MIKKITFIILASILLWPDIFAQELNLDKILANYYKANGIDKLQKVKSIVMTGTITRNDLMPLKITKMRPDKFRMDFELADLAAVQAYDGKTGWSIAPWTGNPKASAMDEEAIKDIKVRADFDGILYKWKEKGHLAELVGKDTIKNTEVYKIKLTRKDGGIEHYFIDTKDFLLQKREFKRIFRGQELEMAIYFRDYKKVDDMTFAYINETIMNGQPYSLIEFEKIEFNTSVDEKIFNFPQ
jgi:outer membrane lipoprotein-sorting protein